LTEGGQNVKLWTFEVISSETRQDYQALPAIGARARIARNAMRQVEANLNREVEAFSCEMLEIFHRHQLTRQTTIDINSLSLEQAYQVQDRYVAARVSLGERVVGWKVGCTSKAIREQLGLAQPICGRLLKPYVHEDDADFLVSDFINCAVEPEMIFHIGTDLLATMDDVALMNSIVAVSPGIELHNCRFWYGKPSSQELIAANGIHAALVVGRQRPLLPDTDLALERVELLVNGGLAASGIGTEIMGGPFNSLRWLVRHLSKRGDRVHAGDLVIPGSAVRLVSVTAGDTVEASFRSFGRCRARFRAISGNQQVKTSPAAKGH
jgi:2-keto-4-pentenoate hydratase